MPLVEEGHETDSKGVSNPAKNGLQGYSYRGGGRPFMSHYLQENDL
jgi:hypothetical protein